MNTRIRAAVFDLDGTLIDSMPLVFAAYAHAVEPYRPGISLEQLRQQMGGPPRRIFERLLEGSRHVTGAMQRLNEFAAANWSGIAPFPGMIEMIDALKRAGWALALWTGRERESTEWLLRKHGLLERIPIVVCGDDLPSHKPDPAGLREVLRQLGLAAESAVFVGDADVDVVAGSASGVRTLLIRHGVQFEPDLLDRAWHVVDRPGEAYTLLCDAAGKNP